MPLRRIVVAIDGSEPAGRALAFASELARSGAGGPLTLVSAISDPVTFAPTPVAGLEMVLEAEERGAERDLAERAERLRSRGLRVETWSGPSSAPSWEVSPPGFSTFSADRSGRSLIPFARRPVKVRNPWLPGLF